MRQRSLGITALAVVSVMVALYSFMAGIALILAGSVGAHVGSNLGAGMLSMGVAYLGVCLFAYVVGGGFWLQKAWSWTAGVVLLAVFVILTIGLALLGSNPAAAVVPGIGTGIALWYLFRPGTKAALRHEAHDDPFAAPAGSQQVGGAVERAA